MHHIEMETKMPPTVTECRSLLRKAKRCIARLENVEQDCLDAIDELGGMTSLPGGDAVTSRGRLHGNS